MFKYPIYNMYSSFLLPLQTLRSVLDQRGYQNVLIIAADEKWEIATDIQKDADLAKIIHAIGYS